MTNSDKGIQRAINEALAIESQEAIDAGQLGFMARILVQVTMPHSKPKEHYFQRKNGTLTLTMMSPPDIGLPYGNIPRLILTWMTTEAVRTKSREIYLGDSMAAFMKQVGINDNSTGGVNGSLTRMKDQVKRLFSTHITCVDDGHVFRNRDYKVTSSSNVWWEPKNPENEISTVKLDADLFEELIDRPVPIDMRALRALKRSPMAIDIYTWLTYRMSYINKPTVIPWDLLQAQFGSQYKEKRIFKKKFIDHLKKVITVYPELRLENNQNGLLLKPSPTHVAIKLPSSKKK